MNTSEHHLPAPLRSAALQAAIVRALQEVYEVNQDRHDPDVGDDGMTFGTHIWRSSNRYLTDAVRGAGGTAEEVQRSLRMQLGKVEMRHHKLGDSELDNPWACVPGNAGPAARMAGRAELLEPELALEFPDEDNRVFLDWVIGSYGNPEDGLRAVRLQAVGSTRALDGTISRWEAVYTLFDAASSAGIQGPAPQPPTPSTPQAPAADIEVTPEPDVDLHPELPERHAEGA